MSELTDRQLMDEMNRCNAVIRPTQQKLDRLNAEWTRRHVVPCDAACLERMAGDTIR